MLKPVTVIALSSVALALVLVLLLSALPIMVDTEANKNRIQAFASQALAMEVRIDGPLGIGFFPGLHLTLQDIHLSDGERAQVMAKQASVGFALLPLIVGKIRIQSINLSQPNISIVRVMDADSNPGPAQSVEDSSDVLEFAKLSFTGAALSYSDPRAYTRLAALDCDLQMQQLRLIKGPIARVLQSLSFTAELSCGQFQQNIYHGSDLTVTAVATNGVVSLAPVTMQFLGGHGTGNFQAIFSGPTPQYQVHYVLPQLQLKGLLSTLPPALSAEGTLDLVLNLALRGGNAAALTQSFNGTIFLHGVDLKLTGIDLDNAFEQFESSQNFNLIDAGAIFFVGPLGLLATKGYDFTSLLQETGGTTEISSLNSDWVIVDGVARSADVALATRQNRIALQGQLDLVNRLFDDVIIALIDGDGCSLVQQQISGSLLRPEADGVNAFTILAGPVINLLEQGAELFTDEACEVFYSGTVRTR